MKYEWLTSIQIGFENVEVYSLPIKNVRLSIHENGMFYHCQKDNLLHSSKQADYVNLVIDCFDNERNISAFDETKLRDRLTRHSDIVSITLIQNVTEILNVYVPWNPEKEYNNDWQKISLHPYGNENGLQIIIENPNRIKF
jgi:hypothetical protein